MRKVLILFCALTFGIVVATAREPQRGYRGFIEWDNAIGSVEADDCTSGDMKKDTYWFFGCATSHGYQFNNHVFLGGGTMLSVSVPINMVRLPIYANFRYDYANLKFRPYVDMRLGYDLAEDGVYFSPTIGYRFNRQRKGNFNLGIGLTVQGRRDYKTDAMFTVRLGWDF